MGRAGRERGWDKGPGWRGRLGAEVTEGQGEGRRKGASARARWGHSSPGRRWKDAKGVRWQDDRDRGLRHRPPSHLPSGPALMPLQLPGPSRAWPAGRAQCWGQRPQMYPRGPTPGGGRRGWVPGPPASSPSWRQALGSAEAPSMDPSLPPPAGVTAREGASARRSPEGPLPGAPSPPGVRGGGNRARPGGAARRGQAGGAGPGPGRRGAAGCRCAQAFSGRWSRAGGLEGCCAPSRLSSPAPASLWS